MLETPTDSHSAAAQPLSTDLREHTMSAHETAENSTFMADLMQGQLDLDAFAAYTAQLWFVYTAMEQTVRAVANTALATGFADVRLERRKKLEHDLEQLIGSDWADKIQLLPATARYMTRLAEISNPEHAHLVIAHHYVRYLGDIAGGQVVARKVRDFYAVPDSALTFYDFSEIGRIPHYRNNYRALLDGLVVDDVQRADMLSEAARAFSLNSAVFGELSKRTWIGLAA